MLFGDTPVAQKGQGRNRDIMFGYVITNNNTGTDSGFWSPFPHVVVKLSDLWYEHVSMLDRKGNMRHLWDYWSVSEELDHRWNNS